LYIDQYVKVKVQVKKVRKLQAFPSSGKPSGGEFYVFCTVPNIFWEVLTQVGSLDRAILILWSQIENNYLRGPTNLCREPDIISEIRKERLQQLGHVERMPEERTVMKVFKNIPEGKRPVAKP
jgi:hypothetical protein